MAALNPGNAVPDYWKSSSIRVLFKKGDQRLPENYRPICIIPVLYKLFSRVLAGRIKDKLLEAQSEDQAGFRPGYSCEDHLFAITLLAEKYNEYNKPLWVATLDFKKAFDSVRASGRRWSNRAYLLYMRICWRDCTRINMPTSNVTSKAEISASRRAPNRAIQSAQ